MNAAELVQEYFTRTNTYRTDLNALAEFIQAWESGDGDGVKLIKLFWHTFRPRNVPAKGTATTTGTSEELSPLPDDSETAFLELLAGLESECRIPYVPDSDDLPDFSTVSRYIYVGAVSALRHRRRDGFSDYVTQTLNDVWRLFRAVEREGYIDLSFPLFQEKLPSQETVSLYGVAASILSEIFHIKYRDGDFGAALLVAANVLWASGFVEEASPPTSPAVVSRIVAQIRQRHGETSRLSNEVIDEEREKRYEKELEVYEIIQACWPWQGLTPQQIVDAFEGLRMRGKSEDWGQVASVCEEFVSNLEYSEDASLLLERVTGADGREEPWVLYWRGAEAWAAAQLAACPSKTIYVITYT